MIEKIIAYWQENEYTGLDAMAEKLGVTREQLDPMVEPAAQEQIARAVEKWRV